MYYKLAQHYLEAEVRRAGGYYLWLCFRCLPTLVITTLILLLLSISPARAENVGEISPQTVETGEVLFRDSKTGRYTQAVLQESKVHFDVSGMIARVRLEQVFHNNSDQWVEAVYAFPLPETAAIRAMEMRIGERRIVGRIKEKSLAKKIYQKAKQAGKKASLVEQQRPNLFTNAVANIGPGEEISVELEYIQQVEFNHGEFSLRFPMSITPRYIPGEPVGEFDEEDRHHAIEINPYLGWSASTDQVPDADAITPLQYPHITREGGPVNAIEITAVLDAGMPLARVESPFHDIAMSRSGHRYEIHLAEGFSEMDRDFLLSWQAVTGATPQAAVFTEQVGGEHYGLLMVVPPAISGTQSVARIPREIIFVVDTSGSMGGVSIVQARESLSLALQQLRPQDAFNVIEFNSSFRKLYKTPVAASSYNIGRALEFVRQLDAGGGTEMLPALREALAPRQQTGSESASRLTQVIFITDGAVGNEQQLYKEITARLGNKRLFTVGIGSAPNSWFMRKAAQFGRGTHTHIGDLSQVGEQMAKLFEQIASPLAANISVQWPLAVESYPQKVPDLYAGEPIVVAVKSGGSPLLGNVSLAGDMAGQFWSRQIELTDSPTGAGGHPGVASLWARQKIAELLDGLSTGKDTAQVRQEVLDVALPHALLSPYSSFVAVEEKISRAPDRALHKTPVPNSRPKGQSPQSFAYPRTATSAPANVLLGSLLLFLAMMVVVVRREEVDRAALAGV